jgi:hypothetical protein
MNFNLTKVCFILSFALLFSCSKEDIGNEDIGGTQSEFGEVGNELYVEVGQFDILDANVVVTELNDGVSTFKATGTWSNSTHLDLLKMMPLNRFPGIISIDGDYVEGTLNAKITDEGVQLVFNDGSRLTVVKYDSDVGDSYSATIDGHTYEFEVTEKSTEDDYLWVGGLYIKIMAVQVKNPSPGVNFIDGYFNHKWGFVGGKITYEDGSVKYAGIDGF